MAYPKHPNQIIIKNKFYPNGLTELDVWNHYQKYKISILKQSKNRDIMTFFKVDNNILVKRKGKTTNFIRLNNQNYDEIITGRTLSIHATMKRQENICIIDVDADDFGLGKKATIDCYDVLERFPIILNKQIRFTGKTSFHILCELSKKIEIDSIRFLLNKIFTNSIISEKYTIGKSRTHGVNIDLFRNSFRGGFIMLNSLSIIGLRCTEVSRSDISTFEREYSKIK
jgi:hypothetical protein